MTESIRRVAVPLRQRDSMIADYSIAFEAEASDPRAQAPEVWARAVLEGGPRWWSALTRFGWVHLLGLRLVPVDAPDSIAGWPIIRTESNAIGLEATSRWLAARNYAIVYPASVVWVTVVRYDSLLGRLLWTAARPLHGRALPRLLRRAVDARPSVESGRQSA